MSLFDILNTFPAAVSVGGETLPSLPVQSVPMPTPTIPQPQEGGGGLFGGIDHFLNSSGLGNVLGRIGDALLVSNGLQPMYAPKQRAKRIGQALQNYLGNLEPGLAEIMSADPETGMALYKMQHPSNETTSGVKEYEYARRNGFTGSFTDFLKITHPGLMSPITLGPNDTYDPGTGGAPAPPTGEVTATGPNGEKVRYNPQSRAWEPMGGPTATPSAGFP